MAAEKGYARAQMSLGALYARGWGVKKEESFEALSEHLEAVTATEPPGFLEVSLRESAPGADFIDGAGQLLAGQVLGRQLAAVN